MRIFILTLLMILITQPLQAAKHYMMFAYDGTTGGTEGKLDNIDSCNADGTGYDLQDKDGCIVWDQTNGRFLFYIYNSSSTASEDDPSIVKPDACDGGAQGAGRWILVDVTASAFNLVSDSSTGGSISLYEGSGSGTNYIGWKAANSLSDDILFEFTDTNPSDNNFMFFAAPASDKSAQTWGSFNSDDFDISSGTVSLSRTVTNKSGNATLVASEMNGIVFMSAAGTLTLPAVTIGTYVIIYSTGANAVTVAPNANDGIRLNGTRDTDGDSITSASGAGDYVHLIGDSADGWTVLDKSGAWTAN